MELLLLNVRHAIRALLRRRGFAAGSVLTLAIGFAAAISSVTLYRAVLLRPLPVPKPESLTFLHRLNVSRAYYSSSSYPSFLEFRDRVAPLLRTAAYTISDATFKAGGDAERVSAIYVSDEYFDVLHVSSEIGRLIVAASPVNSQDPILVLSAHIWRSRFATDPSVLGRSVTVDGRAFTVIGVASSDFSGLDPGVVADVWIPLTFVSGFESRKVQRGMDWLEVVGRWNPGHDTPSTRLRVTEIARNLAAKSDTRESWTAVLSPGAHGNLYPHVRERIARLLSLFSAFGLLVLVVAGANVTNLLAARTAERQREIVIRTALGGSRTQVIASFLIEGALIATAAVIVGMLFALWVPPALGSFTLPGEIPVSALVVDLDLAMVTAALMFGLVAGLGIGAAVAMQASRDVMVVLRTTGVGADRRRSRVQRAMVTLQIAGSVVLVVLAALLLQSLRGQLALNPDFRSKRLVLLSVDLSPGGTAAPVGPGTFELLAERIAGAPGVQAAGWASVVPFGTRRMRRNVVIDGVNDRSEPLPIDANVVSPGFFRALGIPLVRGRTFTDADRPGSPLTAVVNETMAARFWPGEDVVGKTIRGGPAATPCTIVGIVRDNRYYDIRTLRSPQRPYLYLPLAQNPQTDLTLLVRKDRDDRDIAPALRDHVRSVLPDVPPSISTAVQQVDRALSQERLAALLGSVVAFFALGLAVVGLYAVIAHAVHKRVREIAVRMALGARPSDIRRLVLLDGIMLAGSGVAGGIAAAVPLTRLVSGLLRDVATLDFASFLSGALLVAAISLLVLALPAALAGRVDPAAALRSE